MEHCRAYTLAWNSKIWKHRVRVMNEHPVLSAVSTSMKTDCIFLTKSNRLMPLWEKLDLYDRSNL
jgi:hypothetical protein